MAEDGGRVFASVGTSGSVPLIVITPRISHLLTAGSLEGSFFSSDRLNPSLQM
jgi:hypothetical protein